MALPENRACGSQDQVTALPQLLASSPSPSTPKFGKSPIIVQVVVIQDNLEVCVSNRKECSRIQHCIEARKNERQMSQDRKPDNCFMGRKPQDTVSLKRFWGAWEFA